MDQLKETWAIFVGILGAMALIVSIIAWIGRLISGKYQKQHMDMQLTTTMQADIKFIKESLNEIKGRLDGNNSAIIELAKEQALLDASLKRAWDEIEDIKKDCKEVQAKKAFG